MAVITVDEVNQFLPTNKLKANSLLPELVTTAKSTVFGRLSLRYTTTSWVDEGTTPDLVRSVVAMYYAGLWYNAKFSDNAADSSSYGNNLIRMAMEQTALIVDGVFELDEADPIAPSGAESYEAIAPAFTMGARF